ncbi:MAG: metallopeptidase TldD-related protein, partial [bacterium]
DDGTIPRKNGTTPFDGEGFQKQPITIIDKGVIKNYLLDIVTAKKLGMKPNGSSSRGIFSPPAPSISNIIVGNGDTNLKELLKYFPKAILVDGLLGIGQGNVLSGAFSNPVALAFFVENGEIVGRVKNLAIAGNIYECLKNITAISEEREWKGGVYLLPHILLDNLSITGGE